MQEMQKFTLGTAVLAGGKGSRMGQNKVLMEYQNRRFLDRICEELRGSMRSPVFLLLYLENMRIWGFRCL